MARSLNIRIIKITLLIVLTFSCETLFAQTNTIVLQYTTNLFWEVSNPPGVVCASPPALSGEDATHLTGTATWTGSGQIGTLSIPGTLYGFNNLSFQTLGQTTGTTGSYQGLLDESFILPELLQQGIAPQLVPTFQPEIGTYHIDGPTGSTGHALRVLIHIGTFCIAGPQSNWSANLQIILDTIAIITQQLATGTVGVSYGSVVTAVGATSPLSWSGVGLPPGLSISPTSGLISGTPTQAGTFPVTIMVKDYSGLTASAQFQLTVKSSTCQVNLGANWSLSGSACSLLSVGGPPWSQGDPRWSTNVYNGYKLLPDSGTCVPGDVTSGCTIRRLGCALSALAMSLDVANVTTVGGQQINPGTLNDYMELNNLFDPNHNVVFAAAVGQISGGSEKFLTPAGDLTSASVLQNTLCSTHSPVIVGVNLIPDPKTGEAVPGHYVLVIGFQNGHFQIADPGDCSNITLDTTNQFEIRGSVTDPAGDLSRLVLVVGDNSELLVADPSGGSTGFDSSSRTVLRQIPNSVHFIDSLEDDLIGLNGPRTGISHTVQVYQPQQGNYTITLTGLELGNYVLSLDAFSQDGAFEPRVLTPGIAAQGSSSSFQVVYSSTPGASSTISRVASSQTALADITNSLQLGLIDNTGIANSLTRKIQAAASAAAEHENDDAREVLNAFKHEVSAQHGKHITGIAAQVLQEDADSLISQLPKE